MNFQPQSFLHEAVSAKPKNANVQLLPKLPVSRTQFDMKYLWSILCTPGALSNWFHFSQKRIRCCFCFAQAAFCVAFQGARSRSRKRVNPNEIYYKSFYHRFTRRMNRFQVRSWPSKPHTFLANRGDQSSYPVTAVICASIFQGSTEFDGNKLLEFFVYELRLPKWDSPFYIHLSFMYFVTDSGVKCVFPSKPVLVPFKMLRLRQPWRTEATTSVASSQLKWVISLQGYLLYLLWVAVLFWQFKSHVLSWTNVVLRNQSQLASQQCIECILIYRIFPLSVEHGFATFLVHL